MSTEQSVSDILAGVTVVRSGVLSLAGTVLRAVVQIGTNLVLARVLGPHAYGVAAAVLGLAIVLELLRSSGIAAVVLRSADLSSSVLVALHRISASVGLALGVLVAIVGAVLLAALPSTPYGPLVLAIAVAFPLAGAVAVPAAGMAREHAMGQLVAVESCAVLLASGAAVCAVLAGLGPLAVVVQVVVLWSLVALGVVGLGRVPRGAAAPWTDLRSAVGSARDVSLVQVVGAVVRAGDRTLVAALFGPAAAGAWAQAMQLVALPLEQVGAAVQRVAVPVLASSTGDALVWSFRRVAGCTTLLVWPLLAVLGVLAEPVVTLLFGPAWTASAAILPVLAVAGAAQALSSTAVWYFVASGRSAVQLRWSFVSQPVILTALVVGSLAGVVGTAVGYAAACVALVVPSFLVATRGAAVRLLDLVLAAVPAGAAATAAAVCAWFVHDNVPSGPLASVVLPGGCAALVALLVAACFPSVRGVLGAVSGRPVLRSDPCPVPVTRKAAAP